jgi:hypothetical protein
MNVYFVLSETMTHHDMYDGPEDYAIVEMVAARNRSQARWLAWKTDHYFEHDPRAMPKFSIKKLGTMEGEPRLLDQKEAAPWYERVDGPCGDDPAEEATA